MLSSPSHCTSGRWSALPPRELRPVVTTYALHGLTRYTPVTNNDLPAVLLSDGLQVWFAVLWSTYGGGCPEYSCFAPTMSGQFTPPNTGITVILHLTLHWWWQPSQYRVYILKDGPEGKMVHVTWAVFIYSSFKWAQSTEHRAQTKSTCSVLPMSSLKHLYLSN